MPQTIIVVPCYNEARRLATRAFTQFRATGHWVEFLFVNDGSTDETLETLGHARCQSPDTIRVLDQQPNRGKAEAVRAGMLDALATDADYVGYWDADLATPLAELQRFLELVDDRSDVVVLLGRVDAEEQLGQPVLGRAARFLEVLELLVDLVVADL